MNKIIIEFDEKSLNLNLEEPESIRTIISLLLQGIDLVTNQTIEDAAKDPEVDVQDVREDFYDMINGMATELLHRIDPSDHTPGLTEVAILFAENELLKKAQTQGLTLEQYLPLAKAEQERDLKLLKMNEAGQKRHIQKQNKQKAGKKNAK